MTEQVYVVVSNPPEIRASHVKTVCETQEDAEEESEKYAFSHIDVVPLVTADD